MKTVPMSGFQSLRQRDLPGGCGALPGGLGGRWLPPTAAGSGAGWSMRIHAKCEEGVRSLRSSRDALCDVRIANLATSSKNAPFVIRPGAPFIVSLLHS